MFKKGEYILHGTAGVCQVEGILKPDFSNNDKVHYSLMSKPDQDTTIYIPADIPKIKMKEIMTRQEAEQFILVLSSVACKRYVNDKERPQVYRRVPEPGDCVELASMIKEISEMEQHRRGKGKSLSIRERDGVKSVWKLLFGELPTALDICPEEVPNYITSQIGESWYIRGTFNYFNLV